MTCLNQRVIPTTCIHHVQVSIYVRASFEELIYISFSTAQKPATTNPSPFGGSLFGQSTTSGGLFGAQNASQPTATPATGSLFGAQPATGTTGGLFGTQPSTATTGTTGTTGGLFGTQPATVGTTGGLFGTQTQAQQQPTFSFAGASTTA